MGSEREGGKTGIFPYKGNMRDPSGDENVLYLDCGGG